MTYGVPYSFVPGTKAKADEVNANFIDVLSKIQDTNTRIDDANTLAETNNSEISAKIEELSSGRADTDLANLSTTGQAVLNAKANTSDIDGNWITKSLTIQSLTTVGANTTKTYSLSSYLPNDGNVYEVIFSLQGENTNLSTSTYSHISLRTDKITNSVSMIRIGGMYDKYQSSSIVLPVGTSRQVNAVTGSTQGGTTYFLLYAHGYRKVR